MGPEDDEHFVGSVCACFQLAVHLAPRSRTPLSLYFGGPCCIRTPQDDTRMRQENARGEYLRGQSRSQPAFSLLLHVDMSTPPPPPPTRSPPTSIFNVKTSDRTMALPPTRALPADN